MSEKKSFDQWCVVEMMGHRKIAGRVSEEEIAGAAFLRIDIPGDEKRPAATQYYGASAVFSITPTTEEIATMVALDRYREPVICLPAKPEPPRDDIPF